MLSQHVKKINYWLIKIFNCKKLGLYDENLNRLSYLVYNETKLARQVKKLQCNKI